MVEITKRDILAILTGAMIMGATSHFFLFAQGRNVSTLGFDISAQTNLYFGLAAALLVIIFAVWTIKTKNGM